MGSERKTTIINLYGGPGAGKSTSAAYVYYLLKSAGKSAELVREYVKDWAYEGRKINTYDQIYFLGKQVRHESMLLGKVDWLVTDCPIFMNLYYASKYSTPVLSDAVAAATLAFYQQTHEDGHRHINVLLKRSHSYVSEGRFQDEAGAKEIDIGLETMFTDLKLPVIHAPPNEEGLRAVLKAILENNEKELYVP